MCKHTTSLDRLSAIQENGRYFNTTTKQFCCFACGTAPDLSQKELREAAERGRQREEEDELLRQEEERSRIEW